MKMRTLHCFRKLWSRNRDKTQTAQIIVRFSNWAARSRVYSLHYQNNSKLSVKTDLTKYRSDLLQTARSYLRDNSLKGYCYSNAECRLVLKNPDTDHRFTFNNFSDFKFCAEQLTQDETYHKRKDEAAQRWLDQTTIVNLNTNPEWQNHPRFTYIGCQSRFGQSIFGNPFKIPRFSREESLRLYEDHVRNSPNLMALLPTLKHRILGCFCAEQCHGGVLVRLIKEL